MASEPKWKREGYPTYYAYRDAEAKRQGYRSFADRRAARKAGRYTAADPARGRQESRRRKFTTPAGKTLLRTTQGRQGQQDIKRAMAKLDPDTDVTVTYTMRGVNGDYEGQMTRKAGDPADDLAPGDWWDWDEMQDDCADDVANGYGADVGATRNPHTSPGHSWVSSQGAQLIRYSVVF